MDGQRPRNRAGAARPRVGSARPGRALHRDYVTVMAVYLTSTTVLAELVGLLLHLALVIGYCLGLVVHFTLQCTFVWFTRGVRASDAPSAGALPDRHGGFNTE